MSKSLAIQSGVSQSCNTGRWRNCRVTAGAPRDGVREREALMLFLDSCVGKLCGETMAFRAVKHSCHCWSLSVLFHVGPMSTKTMPPKMWHLQRDIKGDMRSETVP